MCEITTEGLAENIVNGSFQEHYLFYLILFFISLVGSSIGAYATSYFKEKAKGTISKEIWLSQEQWKEKYRIYTVMIENTAEIADALWSIYADPNSIKFLPGQPSTESDALKNLPEHKVFLDRELVAIEKIATASVGVELLLSEDAYKAIEAIKRSRTRSQCIVNLTYSERIGERQKAAGLAKSILLNASKNDLQL